MIALMSASGNARRFEQGAVLLGCVSLLCGVLILTCAAAGVSLQAEKASRYEWDRELALQAAQSALKDAELEISGFADSVRARHQVFSAGGESAFVIGCGAGDTDPAQGLCSSPMNGAPAWTTVDLADQKASTARTVQYGRFTGMRLFASNAVLPRPPRYLIEILPTANAVATSQNNGIIPKDTGLESKPTSGQRQYRITAIGFGRLPSTEVVLQTVAQVARQ